MKKFIKTLFIVAGVVILLGAIFFVIDYNRVRKLENPIFCINNITYKDGGTKEYLGLGYKVIDFHLLNGYDDMKIGTWFMNYEDFNNEIKNYDLTIAEIEKYIEYTKELNDIVIKFDIPKEWHYEEINNSENQNAKFEIKLYKDSKEKSASLFYYKDMFGVCGTGLISKNISLNNGLQANVGYYDGSNIWTFVSFYNSNSNIAFWNYGLDENDSNELLGIIKTITIKNKKEDSYFLGKVIESNANTIIVEPNEDEEIRKSSDKIAIGLGEHNDALYMVGTGVKITYDGTIMETYPAQINATKIELKLADNFEIFFNEKQPIDSYKIYTILEKNKADNYNYTIYGYDGIVNIKIDNKDYSLKDALLQNKITMNEIIQKANQDEKDGKVTTEMYKDGGSKEYHYENYTIIKCHTIDGNRDVYIGTKDLKLTDVI